MMPSVQQLLNSFDLLPETEQRAVAWEILQRTVKFEFPSLSDEELVLNAESLFLELDRREAHDEQP